MVSEKKERAIWVLYLPVAMVLLFLAFNLFIQGELFTFRYILLLILGIGIAIWPIKTDNGDFSLETGVSIVVFVLFGVVHQLLLSSIVLIVLLRRLKIEWNQHYRYALNLLAITIQSLLSAAGYYAAQSLLIEMSDWPRLVVSLIIYIMIHLVISNFSIYFSYKYFYGIKIAAYDRNTLIFLISTNLIFLFVSLVFLYLYSVHGIWGQLIGMILFIAMTINLNNYYRMRRNNQYLSKVNEHVAKITKNMNRKDVIHSFITSLLEIFPIGKIYYFKVLPDDTIEPQRIYHNATLSKKLAKDVADSNAEFFTKTIKYNEIRVYNRGKEWVPEEIINDHSILAESAMTLPVEILGNVKGIILLVNEQRFAYSEFIVSLIEVFHHYFTNVLHNADQYEKLEVSLETDDLTKLANFKGFSEKMKRVSEKNDFETLSIIMLDLDFFKKVNDTHGHKAGNEVLVQLAEVLKTFSGKDRFISRYGGEEFILLLRNHGKQVAYDLAEDIRVAIAEKTYHVNHSILETGVKEVQVTASIGVATYPDDTKDIYKLVLLADGLMYKLSKQTGRNKVSIFN